MIVRVEGDIVFNLTTTTTAQNSFRVFVHCNTMTSHLILSVFVELKVFKLNDLFSTIM